MSTDPEASLLASALALGPRRPHSSIQLLVGLAFPTCCHRHNGQQTDAAQWNLSLQRGGEKHGEPTDASLITRGRWDVHTSHGLESLAKAGASPAVQAPPALPAGLWGRPHVALRNMASAGTRRVQWAPGPGAKTSIACLRSPTLLQRLTAVWRCIWTQTVLFGKNKCSAGGFLLRSKQLQNLGFGQSRMFPSSFHGLSACCQFAF